MREIKFRAWDEYNKKWIYFSLESLFGDLLGKKKRPEIVELWHARNYDLKIYRYTGLKDKNGKEICEGDVVKGEVGNAEIVFGYHETSTDDWGVEHGTVGFARKWDDGSGHSELNPDEKLEIIGNIHENPELLEKRK